MQCRRKKARSSGKYRKLRTRKGNKRIIKGLYRSNRDGELRSEMDFRRRCLGEFESGNSDLGKKKLGP